MEGMTELARRIKGVPEEELPVDQHMQLAEIGKNGTCNLGKMVLDREDYKIAQNIKNSLSPGDEVAVMQLTDEKYLILAKVVDP